MTFRMAIDSGSTFTDGIAMDATGEVVMAKAHSTPDDPCVGTVNCLKKIAERSGFWSRPATSYTAPLWPPTW